MTVGDLPVENGFKEPASVRRAPGLRGLSNVSTPGSPKTPNSTSEHISESGDERPTVDDTDREAGKHTSMLHGKDLGYAVCSKEWLPTWSMDQYLRDPVHIGIDSTLEEHRKKGLSEKQVAELASRRGRNTAASADMGPGLQVRRDGRIVKKRPSDVVTGDVLVVAKGDRVPAVCRVLKMHHFEVSLPEDDDALIVKQVGDLVPDGIKVNRGEADLLCVAVKQAEPSKSDRVGPPHMSTAPLYVCFWRHAACGTQGMNAGNACV